MRKFLFKKLSYVCVSLLFITVFSCDNLDISSTQADSFIKLFGSWSTDIGNDVKPFNNGYIVLATITSQDANYTDIALIQTDKFGNQLGDIDTIDGGGNDLASKLLLTNDGGFIIIGTLEDTLNDNEDILLAKYDASAELEWQKTIGSSANEQGISIKATQTGFIIAGNTDKSDLVTGNTTGTWDIYLVKTDETGNIEWENNFGANGTDKSSDIILHNNGYLIIGVSNSFNESGQGGNDIIAIKTNSTGGETDKFTYGSIFNDYGSSVLEADDGFVIVGSVENIAGSNSDMYVLKVDKNDLQNIIWNKSFGKTLDDSGYDILKSGENIKIIGSQGNISGSYAYCLTIDNEGNSIEEKLYGGYNQVLYSFEPAYDGGYIMVGSSGQEGNEQICLIKVNALGEL
ncbi:MAG: hypothetical protein A2X13_08210 [Bacteroidetes bacterium GWC2_33_15]|nr:MAG: hypothetical protein A2X10_12205 [Bacteroidetes bacterium GWA2_33_15]OFX51438.1 MAG: hypothetical protein A2X13_08210 [Bacteroidetes bacterium GWC2_33_15]OFX65815.1 MAG: hypothetical protein A2X15_13570 [Bacteroidetes bacterium GWB2_32_14]OFX67132.1 MAG: hypothetical protein A2X14_02000 [Bacteroidetes bacterium GWD2_33_33]HAN18513.1 hypothetical protein [Bacteroidales bacterium]